MLCCKSFLLQVLVQHLSHSDWVRVSQRFGLQEGDGRERPAVKWLATPLLSKTQDGAVESCDSYTSANGLYE
jgi:hypothetical protein